MREEGPRELQNGQMMGGCQATKRQRPGGQKDSLAFEQPQDYGQSTETLGMMVSPS